MKHFLCLMGRLSPISSLYKTKLSAMVAVMSLFMCLITAYKAPAQTGAAVNKNEQQAETITGVVVDTLGHPIEGATVSIRGTSHQTQTDEYGRFALRAVENSGTLRVRFVGYHDAEASFTIPSREPILLELVSLENVIEEVEVSTGYQTLPKERATGSFVHVNSTTLNRNINTNILQRLDGVVGGVLSNRYDQNSGEFIQIRGLSGLSNSLLKPLIILDDFPYEGEIENINPNDIQNITILRDAAAASIWGARAGNGVIVLKSKSGKSNRKTSITARTNFGISDKTNLQKIPVLPSEDFVEFEKELFHYGYFDAEINSPTRPPLSPVIELLYRWKEGTLSDGELQNGIKEYSNADNRDQFSKYIYQHASDRQYSLSVAGGGENANYSLSVGHDATSGGLIGATKTRTSLNKNFSLKITEGLTVDSRLMFSNLNTQENNSGGYAQIYMGNKSLPPYVMLMGHNGVPLEIDMYRKSFTDTIAGGMFDWSYSPVLELDNLDRVTVNQLFLANLGIKYALTPNITFTAKYQGSQQLTDNKQHYFESSFVVRDLVNTYAQISSNGEVDYPIPPGGVLDVNESKQTIHNGRLQIDFQKNWRNLHNFMFLAGTEMSQQEFTLSANRNYGFNERYNISTVDYLNRYQTVFGSNLFIPNRISLEGKLNRFISTYSNFSYDYKNKYVLSGSIRKDAANIFGLKANERGVPLWSIGTMWVASDENFWPNKHKMKIRASYGFNGNVNPARSALTTLSYYTASSNIHTNLPYATISNHPNPTLRWEKISTINLGVDYSSPRNNVLVTLEYFKKNAKDIYGAELLDLTTGIPSMVTNSASMVGEGLDLSINLNAVNTKYFRWDIIANASAVKNKITEYLGRVNNNGLVSNGNTISPIIGRHPYAIVSYRWAGLSEADGSPTGYLDNEISKDYNALTRLPVEHQVYSGSSVPPYFGNLLNKLRIGTIQLSWNISYRLGHYFRKPSLVYDNAFYSYSLHPEFSKRWRSRGDENHTNVPSMIYPNVSNRDRFYAYSEINVLKGGYFRMEDIRLDYSLDLKKIGIPFVKGLDFALMANNLNFIIWNANKAGIDPNFITGFIPPKQLVASLSVRL